MKSLAFWVKRQVVYWSEIPGNILSAAGVAGMGLNSGWPIKSNTAVSQLSIGKKIAEVFRTAFRYLDWSGPGVGLENSRIGCSVKLSCGVVGPAKRIRILVNTYLESKN